MRLLKLLEIIESLHCIIDHLTNIRAKWFQPKIFKSIFFIMCMTRMIGVSCISLYKGVQQKVYFLHRDQFL